MNAKFSSQLWETGAFAPSARSKAGCEVGRCSISPTLRSVLKPRSPADSPRPAGWQEGAGMPLLCRAAGEGTQETFKDLSSQGLTLTLTPTGSTGLPLQLPHFPSTDQA